MSRGGKTKEQELVRTLDQYKEYKDSENKLHMHHLYGLLH